MNNEKTQCLNPLRLAPGVYQGLADLAGEIGYEFDGKISVNLLLRAISELDSSELSGLLEESELLPGDIGRAIYKSSGK